MARTDDKAFSRNWRGMNRKISVVLCAFNPRRDLLRKSLAALARQTLARDEFELIVVDNNSSPALQHDELRAAFGDEVQLVREREQGLSLARVRGIGTAAAEIICFVDDDNILDAEYLETAYAIATAEPKLGAFGGRTKAQPEKPVSAAFSAFFPYFGANDHGDMPLTGDGVRLGPWTPIGAGLCVRREVGALFQQFVREGQGVDALGRRGTLLLSGEDTVFSFLAGRAGFSAGYRPALSLDHVIAKDRLNYRYLARLMEGHGRSSVMLRRIFGAALVDEPPADGARALALNALRRLRGHGILRAYGMYFWDLGRYRQRRESELGEALVPAGPTR